MGQLHIVFIPGYFLFLRTGDPLLENTNHFDSTILIIQEDPGHEVANKYRENGRLQVGDKNTKRLCKRTSI